MWLCTRMYSYITRTLVTICQSSCCTPFVQILTIRMHQTDQIRAIYKFCGISVKGSHSHSNTKYANSLMKKKLKSLHVRTLVYMCNVRVHSVQCMCTESDFCPPGCHFLYIFASRVSRKNKGEVSQFFGQSVTNDTSTLV